MRYPIIYNGVIGEVEIPYTEGIQSSMVHPEVARINTCGLFRTVVQDTLTYEFFSSELFKGKWKMSFKNQKDVDEWIARKFNEALSNHTYEMYKSYLDSRLTERTLSEVAAEFFKDYIFIDDSVYHKTAEPVYEVRIIGNRPELYISNYDPKNAAHQFRYDEIPLITPYVKAIIGAPYLDGATIEPPHNLSDFSGRSNFRIEVLEGYVTTMPSRDIRIMDWLEASVRKHEPLFKVFGYEYCNDEAVFFVMRKLVEMNNGLNFAMEPSTEEIKSILEGEIL